MVEQALYHQYIHCGSEPVPLIVFSHSNYVNKSFRFLPTCWSGLVAELAEQRLEVRARLLPKRIHQQRIFQALLNSMPQRHSLKGEDDDVTTGADGDDGGLLNLDEELQHDSKEFLGNLDYTIVRGGPMGEVEEERRTTVASATKPPTDDFSTATGKLRQVSFFIFLVTQIPSLQIYTCICPNFDLLCVNWSKFVLIRDWSQHLQHLKTFVMFVESNFLLS
jgi:hypothetical protein